MDLAPDLQTATFLTYAALVAHRRDWRGALIMTLGLGPVGLAVAFAANIAGAVCLAIEPDPTICRRAMRLGAVDFVVNTPDESLRVLKNEIRQGKPLSVGLEFGAEPALAELLERGVLPEVFLPRGLQPEAANLAEAKATWAEQGAALLLPKVSLQMRTLEPADGPALRALDTRLAKLVSADQPLRAWYLAAPRLFHRDRPYRRVVHLSPDQI